MKTPAVVWPIKNVHFLNIIRRKRLCVSVYVCGGSHGDGGGICKGMYVSVRVCLRDRQSYGG